MADYKKQHWLPKTYLRQFKSNSIEIDKIYLLSNTKIQKEIPLDNQCQKPYTYSSEKPEEAESKFKFIEENWTETVNNVKDNKQLSNKSLSILREGIIDFHARNIFYENHNNDKERIEAYQALYSTLFISMCSSSKNSIINEKSTTEQLDMNLLKNWIVKIKPIKHDMFTSDNPSLAYNKSGRTVLFILPLTPKYLAILYDKTKIIVKPKAVSKKDIILISQHLWKSKNSCLYSNAKYKVGFIEDDSNSSITAGGVYTEDSKIYFRSHCYNLEDINFGFLDQ